MPRGARPIRASLVRSIWGGPQDQGGEQEGNLQQAHHEIITCTPQRTRAIFTLTTRASTSSYSKRLSARSPLSDFASAVGRCLDTHVAQSIVRRGIRSSRRTSKGVPHPPQFTSM